MNHGFGSFGPLFQTHISHKSFLLNNQPQSSDLTPNQTKDRNNTLSFVQSQLMATLEELSPSVPYIIQSSFATRLAEAKKVAIEAALKERQESLKAVALKLQTLPDPSVLVGQSGGNEGVKVDQNPTIPFRLSAPYSLKSAGKRKRPTGEDNTSPRRTSASAKSPKQEDTPPVMM